MKRAVILIMILSIISSTLAACANESTNDTNRNINYNHSDTFVSLKVDNTQNTDGDHSSDNTNSDNLVDDIPNENDAYEGIYESNIIITDEAYDIDIYEYEWFIIPEYNPETLVYDYYNIYQYIIFGINEYFSSNVSDIYTCKFEDDIIEQTTTMIFKVLVHGENSKLEIALDMYHNDITISEVE